MPCVRDRPRRATDPSPSGYDRAGGSVDVRFNWRNNNFIDFYYEAVPAGRTVSTLLSKAGTPASHHHLRLNGPAPTQLSNRAVSQRMQVAPSRLSVFSFSRFGRSLFCDREDHPRYKMGGEYHQPPPMTAPFSYVPGGSFSTPPMNMKQGEYGVRAAQRVIMRPATAPPAYPKKVEPFPSRMPMGSDRNTPVVRCQLRLTRRKPYAAANSHVCRSPFVSGSVRLGPRPRLPVCAHSSRTVRRTSSCTRWSHRCRSRRSRSSSRSSDSESASNGLPELLPPLQRRTVGISLRTFQFCPQRTRPRRSGVALSAPVQNKHWAGRLFNGPPPERPPRANVRGPDVRRDWPLTWAAHQDARGFYVVEVPTSPVDVT